MISSLCNKSYKERLAKPRPVLFLEKCRLRGKLIDFFNILKGFTNVDADKLFSIDNSSRTMSSDENLRDRYN